MELKKKLILLSLFFLLIIALVSAYEKKTYVNINMMLNSIYNVTWVNATSFNGTFYGEGQYLTGIPGNTTNEIFDVCNNDTFQIGTEIYNTTPEIHLAIDNNTYHKYSKLMNATNLTVCAEDKILKISDGTWGCAADATGAVGGQEPLVWLNSTDDTIYINTSYGQNVNITGYFSGNGSQLYDVNSTRAATIIIAASDSKDKNRADVICTGSNDDATIEGKIANNTKILLLEGNYILNAPIDITSGTQNLTISGQGAGTKLITSSTVIFEFGGDTQQGGKQENIIFENLYMTETGTKNAHGIFIPNHVQKTESKSVIARNCIFDGLKYGWEHKNWNNWNYLINNIFKNNTYGVYQPNGGQMQILGNLFIFNDYGVYSEKSGVMSGNTFKGEADEPGHLGYHIHFDRASYWLISNNRFISGNYSIYAEGNSYAILINSNNMESCQTTCTYMNTASKIIFSNNLIDWARKDIVNWNNVDDSEIVGNFITTGDSANKKRYDSLRLTDCDNILVQGNRLMDSDRYEIYVKGDGNTIMGNILTGSDHEGSIVAESSDELAIIGNSIGGTGLSGINVTNSSGVRIEGNLISNTKMHGIYFYDVDGAIIANNHIKDADIGNTQNYDGINMNAIMSVITGNRIQDSDRCEINLTTKSANLTVMTNILIADDHECGICEADGTCADGCALNDSICLNNIVGSSFIGYTGEWFEFVQDDVLFAKVNSTLWNITSGDFIVDVDTLFVDESTDRVGINTEAPGDDLDVSGGITVSENITLSTKQGLLSGGNYTHFNGTCWIMKGSTATLEVC